MWNTEDYLGNPITWYEEKEYKELQEKIELLNKQLEAKDKALLEALQNMNK